MNEESKYALTIFVIIFILLLINTVKGAGLNEKCYNNSMCETELCSLDIQRCVLTSCGHDINADGNLCDENEDSFKCKDDCHLTVDIMSYDILNNEKFIGFIFLVIIGFISYKLYNEKL